MIKKIYIDGKEYKLATNAYTPILYTKEFNTDYFKDLFALTKAFDNSNPDEIDISKVELLFLYKLFYVFHKTANPNAPEFDELLQSMQQFPLQEVANNVLELLQFGMKTRKKKMNHQKHHKKQ